MKRIENVCSDINKLISMRSLNLNQINVLNTLFMVNEFFTGESESVEVNKEEYFEVFKEKLEKEKQESDEQLDTRDTPELEWRICSKKKKSPRTRTKNTNTISNA